MTQALAPAIKRGAPEVRPSDTVGHRPAGQPFAAFTAPRARRADTNDALTPAEQAEAASAFSRLTKSLRVVGSSFDALMVLSTLSPRVLREIDGMCWEKYGQSLRTRVLRTSWGDKRRALMEVLDASLGKDQDLSGASKLAAKLATLRSQPKVAECELINHYPQTRNNDIELMIQGSNAFPKIFDAIDNAKDSVHVSFYILSPDDLGQQFLGKLRAANARGVKVRLALDGIGSQLSNPFCDIGWILDALEEEGVEVFRNHLFDPRRKEEWLNHPDHRKLVIIDGKEGFTGGMNMADHYNTEYHDVMVRVTGDAVKQMQSEFLHHWLHMGKDLEADPAAIQSRYFPDVPSTPNKRIKVTQAVPGEHTEIFNTYLRRIDHAQKSVFIENPYCTNPQIQDALIRAGERGVEVHVILPSDNDHGFSHLAARQKYPEMIKAGVNIYEYPGFNHGKVMLVDDEYVTIGSSNLDDVALFHIYELNLEAHDKAFAADVRQRLFEVDLKKSKKMRAEDITAWQKLSGRFFNLFSHYI